MRKINVCKRILVLPAILLGISCNDKEEQVLLDQWKQEIIETERQFAEMAKDSGIAEAFETYAAENVVLMRNNKLVVGKSGLSSYFDSQKSSFENVSLTWKPDFVDVSKSGDLGYTYGEYRISFKDSSGVDQESTGIFHTVWKRQPDNTWKFVWD